MAASVMDLVSANNLISSPIHSPTSEKINVQNGDNKEIKVNDQLPTFINKLPLGEETKKLLELNSNSTKTRNENELLNAKKLQNMT